MGHAMSSRPYDRLLEIVGKQAVIVELSEAPQGTVSSWAKSGLIPLGRIPTILRNGEKAGFTIPPETFLPSQGRAAE